jgi:hypothetical protein
LKWSSDGTLNISTSKATVQEITIAIIACQNGDIWNITQNDLVENKYVNISRALRDIVPAIVVEGLVISEDPDSTPFDVVLSAGSYYIDGHLKKTIVSPIYSKNTPIIRWYKSSGV